MAKLLSAHQLIASGLKVVGGPQRAYPSRTCYIIRKCHWCETKFGFHQGRVKYTNLGHFCSKSCRSKFTMSKPKTEKQIASAKALIDWNKKNGYWLQTGDGMPQEAQDRAAATKRLLGDPFKDGGRGGNGRGLTPCEKLLARVLAPGWKSNYAIPTQRKPTKGKLAIGYPNHYKVDFAWIYRKLALEVDGDSHNSKTAKARDLKKQCLLEQLGWTVLRVKNKEVKQMFGILK